MENIMTRHYKILLTGLLILVLTGACSNKKDDLESKKEELVELKKQAANLNAKIRALEKEIAGVDPDALRSNETLVATLVPGRKEFVRNIELRGSVQSRKNVALSSEAMGAIIQLPATEGKKVSAGELLVVLDASVIQNSIKEVDTQLELAKAVYDRQENLWKQKIGTEIQYLQAKSNYESLEQRKKTLQAQLKQTRVTAPFSGVIDAVYVRNGEVAQPGMPLVRLVNGTDMYVLADVAENHLGKFKVGDKVEVSIPGTGESYSTSVKAVGSVINQNNRTFQMEVQLPDKIATKFRPNQVALIKIADYKVADAITVPNDVILSGKSEKYLYTTKKQDGQLIADRVVIETGESADGWTEVRKGLSGNEAVIIAGHREISEGTAIRVNGKN
jgi:membrane fusion protein, multidrug efflux system